MYNEYAILSRGLAAMMESRIHAFIRYAPLLLLCTFPHQVFLIGAVDRATGISIVPYVVVPALAFAIGAGVVIHIGQELFTERVCAGIFKMQLFISIVLIMLGCSHLILLQSHIAGSYFYFLYPLQQLLLFVAYALTPAVHVLAPRPGGASLMLKHLDGLPEGSVLRYFDYRILAALDAFACMFFFAGWLAVSFEAMCLNDDWAPLFMCTLAHIVFGLCVVLGLVFASEPLLDACYWDIWPFRFFGSVAAWPVLIVAFEHGASGVALWCMAMGVPLFVLRVWSYRFVKSVDNMQDGADRSPNGTISKYPVSEIAGQLEMAFPGVILTDRERRCIEMALAGMTSAQIAGELGIRPATVRSYFVRAYRKLGVPDFSALVDQVGRMRQESPREAGDAAMVDIEAGVGKSGRLPFPCLPDRGRSLFALLLLALVLGDPRLMGTSTSFVVACSIILGVTLFVVAGRCRFPSMTPRPLFEGVCIFATVAFHILASGLWGVHRASLVDHVVLFACALIFVPYFLGMIAPELVASESCGLGFGAGSIAACLVVGGVALFVLSAFSGVREVAFFMLLLAVCVDRIGYLMHFANPCPMDDAAPDGVSYLHIDRFLPFFVLGIVSGICMQAVLHDAGSLATDIMLALPLALIILSCCLYMRRLSCPDRWCIVALGEGLLLLVAGYSFWGSARLGLAYVLLILWATVICSRGISTWRALVHALMFGIAAGAAIGLMEFEVRFVTLRALDVLQGTLPAPFDIEFRALILVGMLFVGSIYVLYELLTGPLHDSTALKEGDFQRIVSYCEGRGSTPLQGLVIAHIAFGESGRQIADSIGYSIGSINSARTSAYKLLGVHTRAELIDFLRRELGISVSQPCP